MNFCHEIIKKRVCYIFNFRQISKSPPEILDWLIGLAVRLEFGDNPEEYRKYSSDFVRYISLRKNLYYDDNIVKLYFTVQGK